MSSSKWQPSKGGWGIFGSHGNSEYGRERRGEQTNAGKKAELSGLLTDSIDAMQGQLTTTSALTQGMKDRAENKFGRAESAFGRAEEQHAFAGEKATMQEANADLSSQIGTAQTAAQGKAAAKASGLAANKAAAQSGFAGMGEVQAQHQDAMNDAYGSAAISQASQGMNFRSSMFAAEEGRKNADWALGGASDALDQAQDDMNQAMQEADVQQSNAVAGMAKDISSMVTAFKDATDGGTYTSDSLTELQEDISGGG